VLAMTLSGQPGDGCWKPTRSPKGRARSAPSLSRRMADWSPSAGGPAADPNRGRPIGGGPPQPIGAGSGNQEAPSWSPDGALLAYVNTDLNGSRMMVMRYPDGTPQPLGPSGRIPVGSQPGGWSLDWVHSMQASWSADGAWAAYPWSDVKRLSVVNLERQTESFVAVPSRWHLYVGELLSPMVGSCWLARFADGVTGVSSG